MPGATFDRSIFINCPFDEEYEPILQAILFCAIYLGFNPRLSSERNDSGESRLEKIRELIETSKYSIHDLSRCQARKRGEFYRLNMPFELGIDYGCRKYFGNDREHKKFLILEEKKYRYQASLSDLAGFDIQTHGGDFQRAVRAVRNWLVSEAGINAVAPTKILGAYADFQEWYYERELSGGATEEDIQAYPTSELLQAMLLWMEQGRPL